MLSLGPSEVVYVISSCIIILFTTGLADMNQLKSCFMQPKRLLIGLSSQYILLPLLAYGLTRCFDFNDIASISLILTATSPGSIFSNLFSFLSDANLPLSVSMTISSNILSFACIPINCIIYVTLAVDYDKLVIDYKIMATITGCLLFGFIIGLIISYFKHKLSRQISGIIGIISTLALMGSMISFVSFTAYSYSWQYYIAPLCLSLAGWILSFLISILSKIDKQSSVSIAIEVSSQNTFIAASILLLSIPSEDDEIWNESLFIPMIYPIFTWGVNIIFVSIAYWFGWISSDNSKLSDNEGIDDEDENENNVNNDESLTLPVMIRKCKKYSRMNDAKNEKKDFDQEHGCEYVEVELGMDRIDEDKEMEMEMKKDAQLSVKQNFPVDRTASLKVGVTLTYHGNGTPRIVPVPDNGNEKKHTYC